MAEIGGNSPGAVERTNKEMGKMGYAPPVKPKSSVGMKKMSVRKPKIRNFGRSK